MIISQTVGDKLESLKMEFTKADPNIKAVHEQLFKGKRGFSNCVINRLPVRPHTFLFKPAKRILNTFNI